MSVPCDLQKALLIKGWYSEVCDVYIVNEFQKHLNKPKTPEKIVCYLGQEKIVRLFFKKKCIFISFSCNSCKGKDQADREALS